MRPELTFVLMLTALLIVTIPALAGNSKKRHEELLGDRMTQEYFRLPTERIHARFLENVESADDWRKLRPLFKEQYFYMLGLSPLPPKMPLHATITGSFQGQDFVVDMVHYQSRPHLYVTGNLYRPSAVQSGERIPAVLYVCGHSNRGRNGNKTAYQSNGIWFARHGYICLVVDSLQLGEIGATHHGTYRYGRWWWHSRGYTPAGVECWNGIRGIDYLTSRPDVDPDRIAVTGISGGGAATFWIAAADERVKVAVPISGMADLPCYVTDHIINGHCDCMFLYNTFQWPWTRIAALIAPRPLLFVNSDHDHIFPMDANERVINRLERLYSLFGSGDLVDSVVSIGGHAYRKDIRQAAFRFINTHLKGDPRIVTDSEVDLVTGTRQDPQHPIAPEKLRVFPQDKDIPADERNTSIDRLFIPMAEINVPESGAFEPWKNRLLTELRRVTFRTFPERIEPAELLAERSQRGVRLSSEAGIEFRLRKREPTVSSMAGRIVLVINLDHKATDSSRWLPQVVRPDDGVYFCDPRGIGDTRWTCRNPPNYVKRSYALLGRTADTGRVWDVIAAARYLRENAQRDVPIHVAGRGPAGIIAAYAGLFEPDIAGAILIDVPMTHMNPNAPQFLNVLRVCDIPDVLGMLAPKTLTIIGSQGAPLNRIRELYAVAGASAKLTVRSGSSGHGERH